MAEETPIYYGDSLLQVKTPDKGMQTVGVPERPLRIRGPEGWREYPGAAQRVLQRQPDGSWLDVVWSPNAEG